MHIPEEKFNLIKLAPEVNRMEVLGRIRRHYCAKMTVSGTCSTDCDTCPIQETMARFGHKTMARDPMAMLVYILRADAAQAAEGVSSQPLTKPKTRWFEPTAAEKEIDNDFLPVSREVASG